MIPFIKLANFKCFSEVEIPLKPLTLLTGLNGMGKSSVIQGILALLQSRGTSLSLNGELVKFGTASDILYEGSLTDELSIHLGDEIFAFRRERAEANELPAVGEIPLLPPNLPWQYLGCERLGPRSSYQMNDTVVNARRLGVQGEYTSHFLSLFGDETVAHKLQRPEAMSPKLNIQTEAWLHEISPDTRLSVVDHKNMDLVQLSVSFAAQGATSNKYRPTNVGFGISYILPVIVAGLAAKPDTLLMIENPEAHLHPRGQAAMGDFLSKVAASGAQVIIETHSDHLLNGVRLAVKDKTLKPEDVAIHFFQREVEEGRFVHNVVSPKIDKNGRIDQWPQGFFDQWEAALLQLLTPSK
jgi:predicted ATPase